MQSHDGKTESSWWAGVDVPKFGPLERDETCDVCIVGAGIAGLSVAYHLTKAGKSVIVIDDSGIGDGQTGRTSAHLASEWDDRYFEAAQSLGVEKSKLIYDSHAKAIDSIEAISKAEGIDCEFERVDGWLFLAPNDKPSLIDDELKAAHEAGFVSVEKRDRLPVSTLASGPALRFPNQAQFHPMKYLVGLANAITARGGRIISGERVIDVQGTDPKKKTPAVATTFKGRTVTAREAIAVCTNTPAPINDWVGIYTKQAAYRTFVVAFRVEKGSIPKALYWDTLDPYHYVRIQELEDHDRLLVGGEDHKTGQREEASDDPFAELGRWSRSHFPKVGAIQFQWSGQVQEPDDGVAFIGRAPHAKENVYVCTGDSGMGLTHGAIAGMLISDQILGRPNPWESLYDPSRKPTGNISDFIKENANVTRKYGQHFTGGDVSDAAEIAVGQGAIMRVGASKLAVHRDETGTLHACSAVCTHLGCVVQWNTLEKTWDCPCHGARYDRGGHVIMGPAINDLAVAVPPPDSGSK